MPYSRDRFAPQYFTMDAARAAGITSGTLTNWLSKQPPVILLGDADRAAAASGQSHRLTFNRVMQIALTKELTDLGIPARRAALLAATFSDTDISAPGGAKRGVGELFPTGWTILAAYPGEDIASISHADDNARAINLFFPAARATTRVSSALIVCVNLVEMRVERALQQ